MRWNLAWSMKLAVTRTSHVGISIERAVQLDAGARRGFSIRRGASRARSTQTMDCNARRAPTVATGTFQHAINARTAVSKRVVMPAFISKSRTEWGALHCRFPAL